MTEWFSANKLSLNLNKTVAMIFWKGGSSIELNVDEHKIPLAFSTKFLGVYIDNNLTWQVHLNYFIEKLNTNK